MKEILVNTKVKALKAAIVDSETKETLIVGDTYTVVSVDSADEELPYQLKVSSVSSVAMSKAVEEGWAMDLGCGWVPEDAIEAI